jgi:hypothetical protein
VICATCAAAVAATAGWAVRRGHRVAVQATGHGLVSGALLNFLGAAGPERVRGAWNRVDRARLVDVGRRYDPADVFAFGQAIDG